ncbi:MAG: FAD-dependent oxidoreductase [Actinobacteria bacterium]|nr:FAD-dependent oxidoreductase [Actinomycetota bacterium]
MNLTLVEKKELSPDVSSFSFRPQEPVIWQAGQFMSFTLDHANPDNRGTSRFFTISSAPFEKNIIITTRFAGESSSSFKKAFFKMEVGQYISALPPQGEFVISDFSKNYIFIAGGIGITPFRSILLDLEHEGRLKEIEIFLFYSNRDDRVIFKDLFDRLAGENPSFKKMYIIYPEVCNAGIIKNTISNPYEKLYYISGPVPMVKSIAGDLMAAGINENNLIKDYFPGY